MPVPWPGECFSDAPGFWQGNGQERPAAHPASERLAEPVSEEPFEPAAEILTNPSLVHNEEQEQMLRARSQVQLLLTAPPLPTMYGFCNALVVEESKRRSLKTSSIHTASVKRLLLRNTDKAWAHISVFICVQDICPLLTAQSLLPPQPGALTSGPAGRASPAAVSASGKPARSGSVSPPGALCRRGPGSHQQRLCPRGHGTVCRHFWLRGLGLGLGVGLGVPLSACESRPGMQLHVLQCPGQPLSLLQMSSVPRSRNAGLEIRLLLL